MIGNLLLHAALSLGAADSKSSGETEWKRTVESAKKEGAVVVAGSTDPVMRNEIIPKFNARFDIPVQYTAGGTRSRGLTTSPPGQKFRLFANGPSMRVDLKFLLPTTPRATAYYCEHNVRLCFSSGKIGKHKARQAPNFFGE
jgi:hypothetical protein